MPTTSHETQPPAWLEGEISITAALEAQSRPLHRIIISMDKPRDDVRELEQRARRAGVRIEQLPREQIDTLANGKTHGGLMAEVGERRYLSLEDLLKPLSSALAPALSQKEREKSPFIIMLDGIEDPFNFGQAVRSFYAAGVDGLVVRPRNWMSAAGVVARASAGASELMPTAVADDPRAAADFFKQQGLRIATTARDRRAVSIYNVDLTPPTFLVIGGEKRGMSREFMDSADVLIKIPYRRKFPHSLGTVASASVIAFEMMRQGFRSRQNEQNAPENETE
jgi:23S rRNA (guanosine2251-2'-O)-methyltransferase